MKFSVVTVCYNEEKTIGATIESVISQKYDDYEQIIMDGASTDKTLDIINKYTDDPHVTCCSEPDSGLYDAMNKALGHITGDYVIFMNSGDMFYDENVLTDVAAELDKDATDILYGDVYRRCSSGSFIQKYKGTHFERIKMMLCGLAFCHQTQFTKVSLMKEYGFREDHRITADFDFVVRALSAKRSFRHIDRIICSFDHEGGMSADRNNYLQMTKEDDASIKECFPVLFYLTIIPKTAFRLLMRKDFSLKR